MESTNASEHPNVARIRNLFAAFRESDVDAIQAAFSESAVWHFPGEAGGLAGSHRGRDGILAFLARVVDLTDGTFELDLEEILANDDYAVVFFRGSGQRGERRLDNPTCLKIRLRDGCATEVWEFVWNLDEVERFWS
jgi:ketosteroid isomerase-like protein